jgi:hypothetical protein
MKKLILFTLVISLAVIATLNNSSLAVNGNNGNPLVIFTEISSTELTVNIGSVGNLGPDLWSWSPPSTIPRPLGPTSLGSNAWYWVEPENANLGNRIILDSPFRIQSDVDVTGVHSPPWTPYADGAIQYNQMWIEGADNVTYIFDAQFFDKGDAGTQVPESTTMLLLGSGLLGLLGFSKKFKK